MDFTAILQDAGLSVLAGLLLTIVFVTEKSVDGFSYMFPDFPRRNLPYAALIAGLLVAFGAYIIVGELPDTLQEIVALLAVGIGAGFGAKISHDMGDAASESGD